MKLSLDSANNNQTENVSENVGMGSALLMIMLFLTFFASIIYIMIESFS